MKDFVTAGLFVSFIALISFCIFMTILGIIDICNTNKPKKKYYLITYRGFIYNGEIIIKAKSSLKARLIFQKKYPLLDFVSIEEIKDE